MKETCRYFNINTTLLFDLLHFYNLNKKNPRKKITDLTSIVDKNTLYNYLCIEKHSKEEACLYFNILRKDLKKLLVYYNIIMDKPHEEFKDIIKRISKNDIEKFYIEENHSFEETLKKFNIAKDAAYKVFHFYKIRYKMGTSWYEEDILKALPKDIKVVKKTRKVLDNNQELDIYIPNYNLAIEFNGNYWHSDIYKNKNYHFEKSKLAEEKGINLIHIYQWEWDDTYIKNKIISLLNLKLGNIKNKIFARKCNIKIISNLQAKSFNELNHLQGHRNAQITYGLFYKGELVQIMSFSKTKYNKNLKTENSWEIIRSCSLLNTEIIGGISKLFSHFIKDYNPDFIFSYCNFNKFDGNGYEKLGMKFIGYTGPDMRWIMPNGAVISRNPTKNQLLKTQAKAKIWGAGSKKYLWVNPCFSQQSINLI